MLIKVNSCHDCPLCNNDNEEGNSCNITSEVEEMTPYNSEEMPDKCPLKIGSIIIEQQLKEEN